jgi:hypothetical protein
MDPRPSPSPVYVVSGDAAREALLKVGNRAKRRALAADLRRKLKNA